MFGLKPRHDASPTLRRDEPADSRDARHADDDSSTRSAFVSTTRSTWRMLRLFWASMKIKPPGLRTVTRRERSTTTPTPSVNMQAFRSITTILGYIQRRRISEPQPTPHETEYALDLKVANAVSTILVVNHDVAAVSFRRTVEEIGVVACTNPSNPPQGPKLSSIVCATNPRPDDPVYDIATGKIIAINATDEGNLLETFEELRDYIEAQCTPGHVISLQTHIFVLKKVLTWARETPAEGTAVEPATTSGADASKSLRELMENLLRQHVTNTCFPKILRRLNDKLSTPFLTSLRTIDKLEADEFLLEVPAEETSTLETSEGNEYDQALIRDFISRIEGRRIPTIHKALSKGKFSMLYKNAARKDFHLVIVEILEKFLRGLTGLYTLQLKFEQDGLDPSEQDIRTYKKDLKTTELASQGLQYLTKGTILKVHLQAIEGMLRNLHPPNNHVANGDERDVALEAVLPSVVQEATRKAMTLSESYNNWLCLMVVHSDASSILSQFFWDPEYYQGQDISLQMVRIPVSGPELLSLEELLREPRYLPPITNSSQSNSDIYKFFINSTTGKGASRVRNAIKDVVRDWKNDDIFEKVAATTTSVGALITLASTPASGWTTLAKHVLELSAKLASLSLQMSLPTFSVIQFVSNSTVDKIDSRIRNLEDNIDFFDGLVKSMRTFSGATHCEAILASLLDTFEGIPADKDYKDIQKKLQGFSRVIGVSKRCCPTCHYLLSLLGSKQRPYLVRGAHNTISACTLPSWLPDNIVDEMNNYFGKLLREELEKIMELEAFSQPRTKSVSSDKLSDIGTGSRPQYIPSADFENSSW